MTKESLISKAKKAVVGSLIAVASLVGIKGQAQTQVKDKADNKPKTGQSYEFRVKIEQDGSVTHYDSEAEFQKAKAEERAKMEGAFEKEASTDQAEFEKIKKASGAAIGRVKSKSSIKEASSDTSVQQPAKRRKVVKRVDNDEMEKGFQEYHKSQQEAFDQYKAQQLKAFENAKNR